MTYAAQKRAAIAVAIILAGLAVVQAAAPADFGLTPVMARWLGVLTAMLGVAAGFLPSVRGMGADPSFLANRVWDLPPAQREVVASDLADRAERQALAHAAQQRVTPAADEGGLITRPPSWLPPDRGETRG